MHWLARVILTVGANALALWVSYLYVPGFVLAPHWVAVILIALILSILNFLLKPILTLIFGPVIVITLGLALIVVNAIILYVSVIITNHIDFLSGSIIIQNIPALILATIVISAINFIVHLAL